MLVFCVPACALLCDPQGPRWRGRRWLNLGLCTVGMLAGMVAGGTLLPALAAGALPSFGAAHLAMLAGMVAGTGLAASLLAPPPGVAKGLRP